MYYIAMENKNIQETITQQPTFAKLNSDFHYSHMECHQKYVSILHYHNVYELYFLEEGKRNYIINGDLYTVEPGMLVLIPPGILHETSGSAYKRKLIHFSGKGLETMMLPDYVKKLLNISSGLIFSPGMNTSLSTIESTFSQASKYFSKGDFEGCISCVIYLLHNLKHMPIIPPETTSKNELINQVVAYLKENATSINNLDEVAKKFLLSKSHLCHLFKQTNDITVYDFIIKIRIETAAQLLITTNKKIKEISNECGFNSEYYFSRRFSSAIGISPSKYRKRFSQYNF